MHPAPYVFRVDAPVTPSRTGSGRVQWLNANSRADRRALMHVVAEWRRRGAEAARAAGVPHLEAARVVAVVHKTRRGRWDPSNLAPTAKAIIDGLVDAGVLDDDSTAYVEGPDMRAGTLAAEPHVAIHLYPADAVEVWPEVAP